MRILLSDVYSTVDMGIIDQLHLLNDLHVDLEAPYAWETGESIDVDFCAVLDSDQIPDRDKLILVADHLSSSELEQLLLAVGIELELPTWSQFYRAVEDAVEPISGSALRKYYSDLWDAACEIVSLREEERCD